MKKILAILVTPALLAFAGLAQRSVESNSSVSASQNSSASADRSGVNAQSDTSAGASSQTNVVHQEPKLDNDENYKRHDSSSRRGPKHADNDGNKPGSAAASGSGQLASGNTMQAVLSKPVAAKKNKPGDEVMAKTTQNTTTEDGVVIPKGSKLVGHVTEAKARSKDDSESTLGIAFDHAILKNGQQVPLNATIQALASSQAAGATNYGDDSLMSSAAGSGAMSGGMASSGGGLVHGVSSTVGGTVGAAGSVAGDMGRTAGGVASTSSSATGSLAGSLTSTSNGVFGLPGMSLDSAASQSLNASVISSTSKNVRLDSGTQMLLRMASH